MAQAFNKFQDFVEQLCSGVHNLKAAGDLCKIMLTNTAPTAGMAALSEITEIGAGFGYTAGGEDVQNDISETAGTATMLGTDVVWTAAGGTIGPFRYVVLYNDTPTTPVVDPLIGWWDYGSNVTLQDTETFTWNELTEIFTLT